MFDNLGRKIQSLRKEHHMSQKDLARKLGVSLSTISRWECDRGVIPATKSLLDICCLFHISLHFLAGTKIEHVIAMDTLTKAQQKLLIALASAFKNKGKSV